MERGDPQRGRKCFELAMGRVVLDGKARYQMVLARRVLELVATRYLYE